MCMNVCMVYIILYKYCIHAIRDKYMHISYNIYYYIILYIKYTHNYRMHIYRRWPGDEVENKGPATPSNYLTSQLHSHYMKYYDKNIIDKNPSLMTGESTPSYLLHRYSML